MKKLFLSTALVLTLCLTFTSCREKKEATTEEATEQTIDEMDETEDAQEMTDSISGEMENAAQDGAETSGN